MSRKASRQLINKHHQLEKQRRQAADKGDKTAQAQLTAELASLGGLSHYQQASLQGQSLDRGGDTSKLLLEWLPVAKLRERGRKLRILEIGALSSRNACSTSGIFEMVRIDLNSQEPSIQQQDFMERPLPEENAEKFDMISLSLVLNFVPDAASRGQMLMRTLSFLRQPLPTATEDAFLPSLFVVLPRSCVNNSRYFTESRFGELMGLLGYEKIHHKMTQKLAYSLWKKTLSPRLDKPVLAKRELNPGRARNNFAIILKEDANQPT